MPDYYEILGIAPAASAAEVKTAYLKIARDKHPDRFPDPAQKKAAQDFFARATEAFNTLSNPRNRERYDQERAQPKLTAPAEIAADAHQRGVQMFAQRDFHEAVNLLRSAVHHAPEVARYHADLARALANNPNWVREAADELEQAIKLEPRTAAFHTELARLLAKQGLRLRARRAAFNAAQLAPRDAAIQQLLADLGDGGEPPSAPSGGLLDRLRRKP
jgi:curved DNA-binding protein CbpA